MQGLGRGEDERRLGMDLDHTAARMLCDLADLTFRLIRGPQLFEPA
jgi:hypothetical protein